MRFIVAVALWSVGSLNIWLGSGNFYYGFAAYFIGLSLIHTIFSASTKP